VVQDLEFTSAVAPAPGGTAASGRTGSFANAGSSCGQTTAHDRRSGWAVVGRFFRLTHAASHQRMLAVRRVTVILAADVARYSRLMGADEKGTRERLRGHLRALIEPKIAEYRGRIVKNTGDGFLAEFASMVEAVRCAVEMQRGIGERNAMPWSLRGTSM
jgi:class 3 adenylate cyclase